MYPLHNKFVHHLGYCLARVFARPRLFGIPSHCCDSAASPLLQSPHLTAAWRSLQALDAMSFEHSVLALERAISYSEPVP